MMMKYIEDYQYVKIIREPAKNHERVVSIELLPKGEEFMSANIERLFRLKTFYHYKVTLIMFLPLEELPKYLTHDKKEYRESAQLRYDALTKGGEKET